MAHLIGNVSIYSNCYSMLDIAKYERISSAEIEKLMRDTIKRARDASPEKTDAAIVRYFNEVGAEDAFINCFMSKWSLSPFAKAIKMATEKSLTKSTYNEVYYVMFYVEKRVYHNWKKKGIEYRKTQTEIPSCSAKAQAERIKVLLPKNQVVEHFQKVVQANETKMSEAVVTALDFFMQKNPETFGSYSKEVDESAVSENKMSLVYAYISPDIVDKMWKTLQRYNQVNTPPIKLADFIESAIAEKLDRTPVQYTNPQLYQELVESLEANAELEKEYERYGGGGDGKKSTQSE